MPGASAIPQKERENKNVNPARTNPSFSILFFSLSDMSGLL